MVSHDSYTYGSQIDKIRTAAIYNKNITNQNVVFSVYMCKYLYHRE